MVECGQKGDATTAHQPDCVPSIDAQRRLMRVFNWQQSRLDDERSAASANTGWAASGRGG